MSAGHDCITEVLIATVPPADRLARLHRHLPSSPYFYGAVYAPAKLDAESSSRSSATDTHSSNGLMQTSTASSPILLLRAEFKWHFGGGLEQVSSPPWSWRSEQLCGSPHPYYARDMTRFEVNDLPISMPRRSFHFLSFSLSSGLQACLLACLLLETQRLIQRTDPAAYIVRLGLSSTTAMQFMRTAQIHHVPGWQSENWYECNDAGENMPSIPGALQVVCYQCFDATACLERATALLSESLRMMEVHKPYLQWHMGAYELEGSLTHETVVEAPQALLDNRYLQPGHVSPTNSLVNRKSALSRSFDQVD